jgi:hypothetical protein
MPRARVLDTVQQSGAGEADDLAGLLVVCLERLASDRVRWQTEPIVKPFEFALRIIDQRFECEGVQGVAPKQIDVRFELHRVVAEGQVIRPPSDRFQKRLSLAAIHRVPYVVQIMTQQTLGRISHDVNEANIRIELEQAVRYASVDGKFCVMRTRLAAVSEAVILLEETEIPVLTLPLIQLFYEVAGLLNPAHRNLRMGIQVLVQRSGTGLHCADDEEIGSSTYSDHRVQLALDAGLRSISLISGQRVRNSLRGD